MARLSAALRRIVLVSSAGRRLGGLRAGTLLPLELHKAVQLFSECWTIAGAGRCYDSFLRRRLVRKQSSRTHMRHAIVPSK